MSQKAFYFGCRTRGHYLHDQDGHVIELSDISGFPFSIYEIDTGLLDSWKIPEKLDGRVHWIKTGSPLCFAFCWWDRSGDTRSESNSGFYVYGFEEHEQIAAFRYACDTFASIVSRQKFNLNLQNTEASCSMPLQSQRQVASAQ